MAGPPAASRDVATAASEYDAFLDAVASGRVAPAGGSVIGFAAAGGAALAEMAVTHTLDHHVGAREDHPHLTDAIRAFQGQRQVLLALAAADARVIDRLFGDGALSNRERAFQQATAIPLSIAEACAAVLSRAAAVASDLAPTVRMDLVSGAAILGSAALAALETARVNRDALGAGVAAETMTARIEALEPTIAADLARLETALGLAVPQPTRA